MPLPAEYGNGLLVAITEQRDRADIDRLAAALGEALADAPAAADDRVPSLAGRGES